MPSPLPDDETDDLAARVGRLEVIAADTRADVAFIKATLPHLATKADLADLRTELKSEIGGVRSELKSEIGGVRSELKSEIGGLRSELKSEIGGLRSELKSEIGGLDARIERVDGNIARMEAAMIRWAVGATLAGITAAFTIARLVH
jgi:hypothetical protein